jgi:hypothetical protein
MLSYWEKVHKIKWYIFIYIFFININRPLKNDNKTVLKVLLFNTLLNNY